MCWKRTALLAISVLLFFAEPAFSQRAPDRFQRLDRNNDGVLSRDEVPADVFDQIDTDGNSVITLEEATVFARGESRLRTSDRSLPDSIRCEFDIAYAGTQNPRQRLDLFLPKNPKDTKPLPLVVYIHGGGWEAGSKEGAVGFLAPSLQSGNYAAASIGYRLSGEAIWPAQLYDCKAAIRWLRANAKKYNIDPDRIGLIGTSAGGHLVSMLGTTGDSKNLEGDLGGHDGVSSRVQCVVDLYGPSDIFKMGSAIGNVQSPISKLLGGFVSDRQEIAKQASPVNHVSPDDPPFLIIHGTRDSTVPFDQSELFEAALKKANVDAYLITVTNGQHGNFNNPEVQLRSQAFLDKYLRGQKDMTISTTAIMAGMNGR